MKLKKKKLFFAGVLLFSSVCGARVTRRVVIKNGMDVPVLIRYVVPSVAKWRKFEQKSELLFAGESIDISFPKAYAEREWIAIDGPGGELLGTIRTDKACVLDAKSKKCKKKTKVTVTGTGLSVER